MKKTKVISAKRSFFMSVVSLILCFAMLLGTTWAWFTDEVTSGVNTIKAGNLDIDVTHSNAKVADKSIKGEDTMFPDKNGDPMLWEPGAVSYETITVKNVGNLALKYKINMNVTDYNMVEGTGANLKNAIKVIVLTGSDMLESVTRETVLNLDWPNAGTLESFQKDDGVLYPAGTTGANNQPLNDKETFQLIAYWQPTDNDNKWNLNNGKHNNDGFKIGDEEALFIEFGINVVATQKDYESDSFNNQYDVVDLPALPQSINKKFESKKITTELDGSGNVTITKVGGEVASGTESVQVVNKSTNTGVGTVTKQSVTSVVQALVNQVVAGGTPAEKINITSDQNSIIYIDIKTPQPPTVTGVTYNITLSAKMDYTDKDGHPATKEIEHLSKEQLNGIVTVTLDLPTGLKNVKVAHEETPMTMLSSAEAEGPGFFYNMETGKLTIKSDEFSPFRVTYDNVKPTPKAYVTAFASESLPTVDFSFDFTSMNPELGNIPVDEKTTHPDSAPLQAAYTFKAFENAAEEDAVDLLGITDDSQLVGLTPEMIQDVLDSIEDENSKALLNNIISSRADYLTWRADFTVSFDKDVAYNTVGLAGQYDSFGDDWVGFGLPLNAKANTPIRLLDTAYQAFPAEVFHMSYASICTWVKTFNCGLVNFSEANNGTTATVSLSLYEVGENGVETGKVLHICSIPYTFTDAYTGETN